MERTEKNVDISATDEEWKIIGAAAALMLQVIRLTEEESKALSLFVMTVRKETWRSTKLAGLSDVNQDSNEGMQAARSSPSVLARFS